MIPCDIFGPPNEDGMHVLENDNGDTYLFPAGDAVTWWIGEDTFSWYTSDPRGAAGLSTFAPLVVSRQARAGTMRFDPS